MKKYSISLIAGILMIVLGIIAIYAFSGEQFQYTGWTCNSPGGCLPPPNATALKITYPSSISIDESLPITVESVIAFPSCENNLSDDNPVTTHSVYLATTGFDISPEPNQVINSTAKGISSTAEWTWIIQPKNIGYHSVNVNVRISQGECNITTMSNTFSIVAVNTFGLDAKQAKILAYIGTFLGSVMTLPYLINIWKENQQKQKDIERMKRLKEPWIPW